MKPIIVYLHGLNCTHRTWNFISQNLPEHNAIILDYKSTSRVEDSYASIISKIPKNTDVIIIAHSLGGLLGHLITTRKNDINVVKLITMSTPFGGSMIASFLRWIYPNYHVLKDITPSCKITKEVKNGIIPCEFISFITTEGGTPYISGHNDGVVTISSQTAIESTSKIFVDVNHFEIIQDPRVVDVIRDLVFKN